MKLFKKILFACIFASITIILTCVSGLFVYASSTNFYVPVTPNGTEILYQQINTELSTTEIQKFNTDEQKYVNKGAIKLDEPTNMYNSHSYAWYNQNIDFNCYNISNEEVLKYIQDGSYCESVGNKGDIITYWRIKLEYNNSSKTELSKTTVYLAHSGIIKSINGEFNPDDLDSLKNITVISKWGKGGLYEHSGDNNPYYYDSIHGKSTNIDNLHFENLTNEYIDDALFYVKVYSPKVDSNQSIELSEYPYIFEKDVYSNDYCMYKINIVNSGNFNFIAQSNNLTDLKIFNENMNLIFDQEEIVSSTESCINASLDDGVYYIRISFKNSNHFGNIKTIIERVRSEIDSNVGILVDSQYSGSEVYLNGGISGGNTITEGFTRYLFLNPNVAPSTSRLDYEWYSSDQSKAMVTQYGTVLAKKGDGSPQITITAVYKEDKTIVFTKTFTILDEYETYESSPINVYTTITVERGKATLITLPDNVPYNYNQYYSWKSNNNALSVSSYGTIIANTSETVTITGTYAYNKRVKVIITVNVV